MHGQSRPLANGGTEQGGPRPGLGHDATKQTLRRHDGGGRRRHSFQRDSLPQSNERERAQAVGARYDNAPAMFYWYQSRAPFFLGQRCAAVGAAKAKSLPVFFGGHSSENNLERRVITRLAHICIGLSVGTLSLKTSTLSGVAHRIFFFP